MGMHRIMYKITGEKEKIEKGETDEYGSGKKKENKKRK